MKSARTPLNTEAAALSVSVRAYTYRFFLSVCFLVLISYGVSMGHAAIGVFILSLLHLVFCADVLAKSAYQDIRRGIFSVSVLTMMSVLASCGYNISKTFFLHPLAGTLPNLYIPLASVVTCYLAVGMYNSRSKERSQAFIKKLEDFLPKSARLRRGTREMRVFANELKPGDKIRVKAGEMIPCEGIILQGNTYIEESFITGNMLPTHKIEGNQVYAGTLNQGSDILVRVERKLDESVMVGIVKTIQNSERKRCPRKNLLDDYALIVLIGAILLALGSYMFIYWAGEYKRPLHSLGLLFLALGLGCPLSFFFAAMLPAWCLKIGAKRQQIDIQVLEALAELEKAALVFLDKTGTLTYGKLSVQEVRPAAGHTSEELLSCVVSAEQMVDSPFAFAMQQYARENKIIPQPLICFDVYPGLGVKAVSGKHTLLAGQMSWLQEQGISVTPALQIDKTVICAAKDGKYLGAICLTDALRPGASEMATYLKQHGKELILMSGDTEGSVQSVAAQTGIEKINFGVLPQTKAEIISNYIALGKKTVMIGDGFNDMSALLKADVGVVFSFGKNVYNNWVDIIIRRQDLYSITDLFGLYRRFTGCVHSNVAWSFLCNVLLLIALIRTPQYIWQQWFLLPVILIGSVLILFLNSVRLLRIK